MSSNDDKPFPFSIQDIIRKLESLNKDCTAKVEPDQQTTVGTKTTANNQTGKEQDGSNSGGVSQGNSVESNKQDGDASQETSNTESNNKGKDAEGKREEALHELGKLCKELDYMIRSFKKLAEFENSLKEPLKTLEDNVKDIVDDLGKPELPKQVHNNLRVLRNNITRVKILIPPQHQTNSLNSEGTRALQTTIATGDAGDLPHLYSETPKGIFQESYYFKEIAEKYNSLEMREQLCLLCFAIFPENAEIKKRLLRFWWVGENLISPEGGKDEKGILNATLDKFVEKRLIEPVLKKNRLQPRSYKINPIVRSCLIKFAKDVGFFDYDPEGKPIMDFSTHGINKACMVKSEGATAPWFSDYLKGNEKDKKSEKPKEQQGQGKPEEQSGQGKLDLKLSADLVKLQMLFNFPDKDRLRKASQEFGSLQTLFNLSKQFPALPEEWLAKMTVLKVLYLGKWETTAENPRHIEVEDIDFMKAFKQMKSLRLLSLQGISGIPKIPSTLGSLSDLEILDLRACHNLEKLPDRIGLLKKLTYLDLSECYLLDYMPKRLSEVEELQVLKGFVIVETKDSCTLDDLSSLKNLRKLSINVNTTTFNLDAAEDALVRFKKLAKLKIAWGSGGMPKEDSEQDSSSEKQSKSKKQQPKQPSNVKKGSTEKENKREDKSNEAHSTSTKMEDKRKQNTGVSEQDSNKQSDGLGRAATILLRAKKFKSLINKRKQQDLKGLENLVKLDLQCFPHSAPPKWLVPSTMASLTNLSIRGGKLGHLDHEGGRKWKVETLRLKFLVDFKMNWKEMEKRFPNLKYLEKVRSPRITFCPCDANGVWQSSSK